MPILDIHAIIKLFAISTITTAVNYILVVRKQRVGRIGRVSRRVNGVKIPREPLRLVVYLPPRQEINSSLSLSVFLRIPHTALFAEENNRGFVTLVRASILNEHADSNAEISRIPFSRYLSRINSN